MKRKLSYQPNNNWRFNWMLQSSSFHPDDDWSIQSNIGKLFSKLLVTFSSLMQKPTEKPLKDKLSCKKIFKKQKLSSWYEKSASLTTATGILV